MPMTITDMITATPHYVLHDRGIPLETTVETVEGDSECRAVFGFSNQASYVRFALEASQPLIPYPLVKGYLRNQVGLGTARGVNVQLVVIDASGPRELRVHAATMEEVLQALEQHVESLPPTHHLAFDPESDSYRLESSRIA